MEKTIDKQTLLKKTMWGVDIYAHILRKFYPDEAVIKVVGRDCGICKNPFAGGARTLHIWFQRNNPEGQLSEETAYHKDQFGAIPEGTALDFAELYYKQSGQELLNTLNREMYLNLDMQRTQYSNAPEVEINRGPKFSFFKAPISNIKPHKSITIRDAYNYIIGHYAKEQTETLRSITDKKRAKIYKAANFAYATFSGEFDIRSNNAVKAETGLLCIDFDHVAQLEVLFNKLLQDRYFETVLLFRSPSGDGLKWVIEVPTSNISRQAMFTAVENYIKQAYGVQIDKACKDVSRACFLPHDPQAYINPQYA